MLYGGVWNGYSRPTTANRVIVDLLATASNKCEGAFRQPPNNKLEIIFAEGALEAQCAEASFYCGIKRCNILLILPFCCTVMFPLKLARISVRNFMLSPSVTGHGLHRLGLKSIEVKLKSNEAKPSWTST